MAVLRHSVSVLALDQERVREAVAALCDLAESSRAHGEVILTGDGQTVADIRLAGGRHLRPGARYELMEPGATDRVTLRLREWRRSTAIAVEQLMSAPEMSARLAVRLASPDRPRLLEAEGRFRGAEGSGRMRRGSGKARLDLAAWWAAAGLPPGAPPVARAPATVRVRHLLGEARLYLRPRRDGDGRWLVEAAVTLRGRWLLRPVAAVALLPAGGMLRRGFRSGVERAAEGWNEAVAELLALSPKELRAELTRQATEGRTQEPRDAPQDAQGPRDAEEG
ncbi:hypothetical protein [Streptomyces sp. ITFR-16]|uniref:hypothetical protein n=1 Tax=Streptomyces sp. ITFR-16 TaxID=3075198 RepID=UPI00288996B4|nr:hypothetical protein [Streptomyces sp. ITFR-16]WNI22898.1 hypothetical protein RLT58_13610 [Streptomyces sp. ITFR-16]